MSVATLGSHAEPPSAAVAQADDALFRKIAWRLIPLLFACYVFNYLDRTNIGFAHLQMKEDLGFSDAVFGLGASILFIGFALFEVPSNAMLSRVGIRLTLLRIMVLWGLASTAMMFVTTPTHFYVLRFLIGAFEAGFAPGVLFYFTMWFPAHRRAQVAAMFFMAVGATPIIAGPIAGVTMTYLEGVMGLHGWQWLFIVEGVPPILLGIVAYLSLSNTPGEARWLAAGEKQRIAQLIAAEQERAGQESSHRTGFGDAFKDYRVWLTGLMAFLMLMGVYALAYWQPTMLKGMGLSVLEIGIYSVVPAVCGVVASIVIGRRSDRRRERRWHFTVMVLVSAAGLLATTLFLHEPVPAIACLALSSIGTGSAYAILWSVPGTFLRGPAAASGLAIVSTVAACAGMVAPYAVGLIRSATGSFMPSLYTLCGAMLLAALLMAFVMPRNALGEKA